LFSPLLTVATVGQAKGEEKVTLKAKFAAAVGAALTMAIAACGGTANQPTDTSPIVLGAWYPMTGPIAASGLPQRAGAMAYFSWLNDHGGIHGHKVQFLTEDNAYDPVKTVTAAHKLIDQENVLAIVAANGTATSAAAFPYVLDQAQVPVVNTYGGDATWYNPPKSMLFGIQTLYEVQAQILGKWAAKEGAKNIVVIHSDPKAFVNVANNVPIGIKALNPGATIQDISIKFNTTDYAPIVLQVKNMHPDAVVAIMAIGELVNYMKQADQQGLKTALYSYAPSATNDAIRLAGSAAEGLRSESFTLPPDDSSPAVAEYRAAMAKYAPDQPVDFVSEMSFALAKVAVAAMFKINGKITRDSYLKALETMTNYDSGLMPPITFSSTQHLGTDQVQRVQITNGKWVTVGKYVGPNTNF
jgi:ABC-type branched-subunit amino acid transport system substrate-binding protein